MIAIDPGFGRTFISTASDFYTHTVESLFHDWWLSADDSVVAQYVAAIEAHPEHGPLAREGWLAPPFALADVADCAPGTFGAALHGFIAENDLAEAIAEHYRALFEQVGASGRFAKMPSALKYKVLRGHQTHDMHHVLCGFPPTPLGELAIQAFQLAQMQYPYAAMWLATVTAHMTFVDPKLIDPAMEAMLDGWRLGKRAGSIQFVRLEECYDEPLEALRQRFGLGRDDRPDYATPREATPDILRAAA